MAELDETAALLISHNKIPELLTIIHDQFPPRGSYRLPATDSLGTMGLKITLMKMIRAYHPDKQPRGDVSWREVCSEITMILNRIIN